MDSEYNDKREEIQRIISIERRSGDTTINVAEGQEVYVGKEGDAMIRLFRPPALFDDVKIIFYSFDRVHYAHPSTHWILSSHFLTSVQFPPECSQTEAGRAVVQCLGKRLHEAIENCVSQPVEEHLAGASRTQDHPRTRREKVQTYPQSSYGQRYRNVQIPVDAAHGYRLWYAG